MDLLATPIKATVYTTRPNTSLKEVADDFFSSFGNFC